MSIRQLLENNERSLLSKDACLSVDAVRRFPEEKCQCRTEFQRDRDRVLHCSAFRRLKHKTQVFLSPVGDHYRTRLTHTLEVAQVARTISRAMFLNEDLTEAAALAHDLGHSPFGHAGEDALNEICPHGFKHYQQSVRVVSTLENNGKGLNLTKQVENAILCHTNGIADTKEGYIVRLADKIAYINHDIDDAVRAGILKPSDLPKDCLEILGNTKSERISSMVMSIIENGTENIRMSDEIQSAHDKLRRFLFENVYYNPNAKKDELKAKMLVKTLYEYFCDNPSCLPPLYRQIALDTDIHRAVCDYISGMTDTYAVNTYNELFIPKFYK